MRLQLCKRIISIEGKALILHLTSWHELEILFTMEGGDRNGCYRRTSNNIANTASSTKQLKGAFKRMLAHPRPFLYYNRFQKNFKSQLFAQS